MHHVYKLFQINDEPIEWDVLWGRLDTCVVRSKPNRQYLYFGRVRLITLLCETLIHYIGDKLVSGMGAWMVTHPLEYRLCPIRIVT